MSVVKSKRSQSKIEFEQLYFTLADRIDNMVEHGFYANALTINDNKQFIGWRGAALIQLADSLLYYIKMANSIYPQCMTEWEERRVAMDKAIGVCYAILTHYQRVMLRLKIKDGKYVDDINVISKMINSLKAWRKSDNKLKEAIKTKN